MTRSEDTGWPPGDWPTREQASCSLLFSPAPLGPACTARNRCWVPAMVPWRATEEGFVTDDNLDWYGRFARGRPGVLVVEATGIRDVRSGPLLRIGHDRFLPGLRRLVERVRTESGGATRLLIQIIDFLRVNRRPPPERFFRRYLEIGSHHRESLHARQPEARWPGRPEEELREALLAAGPGGWPELLAPRELEALLYGYRERVTDMHLEHVRRLPEVLPGLFAAAAGRARRAGFDGVELHFAHAYTMAGFLSRLNDRDDGYGGSAAGRVRLPLEVFAAVRAEVGSDWCVGCRYLGDEVIAGGSRLEDAVGHGRRFAAAGFDFLSLSKGGKFEDARQPRVGDAVYPYTGESGHECMPTTRIPGGPFGRSVPLAAAVRKAVREDGHVTPVVTAGGICSFSQAEQILSSGSADFVAAARQSLADPDWWSKMAQGRGAEIRRCSYTNYCEGLDQRHKQVTCRLWDKQFCPGQELALTPDGRRRLVAPDWDQDER